MSLTKDLANKIGNLTASGGGEDQGELFKSASSIMSKLEQTENTIIKKKIKKGDIIKNLSKTPKMDKPIGKLYSMGKSESKEGMGAVSAGGFSGPLMMTKKEMTEKWSQKYKDSIDCNNPKGFSQKAHCQGKSKKGEFKEATAVDLSGSYETPAAWAKSTSKKDWRGKSKPLIPGGEFVNEKKQTTFPGGKFVTVKKKCKTFPYCNQGDINALKLTNEEIINKSIKKLSRKYNISEEIIKKLIMDDYHKIK